MKVDLGGGFGRDWRAEQDCLQSKRRSGTSANGEGVQRECGGGDVGGGGGKMYGDAESRCCIIVRWRLFSLERCEGYPALWLRCGLCQ